MQTIYECEDTSMNQKMDGFSSLSDALHRAYTLFACVCYSISNLHYEFMLEKKMPLIGCVLLIDQQNGSFNGT